MNSSLTLICKVLLIDDTSPPEISWLRHYRDSWTNDESKFGKNGFSKNGRRIIDEYGNPMFDELQTCAINGNCGGRKVLDKPLEYSLKNITKKDEGWYSCRATNHFGVELSTGYVTVVTEMPDIASKIVKAQSSSIYIIIGASVLTIGFLATLMYSCVRCRERKRLRKEDLKIAQNINPVTKWVRIQNIIPNLAIQGEIQWPTVKIERVEAQPVRHSHKHYQQLCKGDNGMCSFGEYAFDSDKEWELDRSKLKIGEILGEGEFGRVASAILDNTRVAVKMLKEGHTDSDVIDLVKEMSVMKQMNHDQPNVIKMIGACTQPVGFPLLVVVEFAEFGNLKEYLLTKKPLPRPPRSTLTQCVEDTKADYFNETPGLPESVCQPYENQQADQPLDTKELINMAWQVSKGMAYLSQRKFVHRDLAARNILVCAKNVYKIADFGMARPVKHKDYYRRTSNGKVPLKWMSPESIFECVHTTQSDVWSYGILLWEIFSFGDSPYKGLGVDVLLEFLKQRIPLIRNGKDYMMEQPASMNYAINQLMGNCWNFDPELRPTWSKIEERTRTFYEAAQPREYLVMAGVGTPLMRTGSDQGHTRNRVGSSSSRLTAASLSTNQSQNVSYNPLSEIIRDGYNPDRYTEDAPLIKRTSTGYVLFIIKLYARRLHRFSGFCQYIYMKPLLYAL